MRVRTAAKLRMLHCDVRDLKGAVAVCSEGASVACSTQEVTRAKRNELAQLQAATVPSDCKPRQTAPNWQYCTAVAGQASEHSWTLVPARSNCADSKRSMQKRACCAVRDSDSHVVPHDVAKTEQRVAAGQRGIIVAHADVQTAEAFQPAKLHRWQTTKTRQSLTQAARRSAVVQARLRLCCSRA